MGVYCEIHVLEQIKEYCAKAKNGEVTIKATKEGTCGHIGGCSSGLDERYQLTYEYDAKADAASRPAPPEPPKEEPEEEAPKEESTTETKTETTATEEKPVEAAPPA